MSRINGGPCHPSGWPRRGHRNYSFFFRVWVITEACTLIAVAFFCLWPWGRFSLLRDGSNFFSLTISGQMSFLLAVVAYNPLSLSLWRGLPWLSPLRRRWCRCFLPLYSSSRFRLFNLLIAKLLTNLSFSHSTMLLFSCSMPFPFSPW